ncbi:MAG: murein L,D-transpeptidase [Hyphomicrobiaceae bacterium]
MILRTLTPTVAVALLLQSQFAWAQTPTAGTAGTEVLSQEIRAVVSGANEPDSSGAKVANRLAEEEASFRALLAAEREAEAAAKAANTAGQPVAAEGAASTVQAASARPDAGRSAAAVNPRAADQRRAERRAAFDAEQERRRAARASDEEIGAAVVAKIDQLLRTVPRADRPRHEALRAFYTDRNGRPMWVSDGSLSVRGAALRDVLKDAPNHGFPADDFLVEAAAFADLDTPLLAADAEVALSKLAVKLANWSRGGRVDPSALSFEIFVTRALRTDAQVLADLAAAEDVTSYFRGLQPRHPQYWALQAAYQRLAGDESALSQRDRRTRDANLDRMARTLEMWRWLPEDVGDTHIVANIPEFTVRVYENGRETFKERVIVGKTTTQTPLFSHRMDHLVFRPYWNIPDSIKVNTLLPGLLQGRNTLAERGLRMKIGTREYNPRTVDWRRDDIRRYHVYQPPGSSNALGNVKFMFPNRHAIYMHDTPSKELFSTRERTHSAGCIRVRNPDQFAKVIMRIGNGWSAAQTEDMYRNGPEDQRVDLDTKIPVHLVYAPVWVDESTGDVNYYPDIYKHERHLGFALAGQYNRIVRVKRDVEADFQQIVASNRVKEQDFYGNNLWFGGGNSGQTSSGFFSGFNGGGTSGPPNSRPRWAQDAFTSDR